MRRRSVVSTVVAALAAAGLVLVGLTAAPGVSGAKPAPLFYLSLGDSYSVGYQPNTPPATGGIATSGYTAVVAKKAKMTLENFGCGGATTSSILNALGCTESGYGPVAATNAVPYENVNETQEQAALAFINAPANAGKVGLITVSIGGNDVTSCANASGGDAGILACIETADAAITANVTSLVGSLDSALTAAGDTTAKIIGITYPDVILGDWVYPTGATNQSLAGLSTTAFDSLINPTLKAAYTSIPNGSFVNVTSAPYKYATTGDDTALTKLKKVLPYGKIPAAVAEICNLTYFCSQGNIHANSSGYEFIGKLIAADFKSL